MEKFKSWWSTSKLWQKVAVVFAVLFLLNILLGSCAGPRYSNQPYNNGQTVIYRDSGSSFWHTLGGFAGGYWLGSRNRGYNDNNYNNQPSYQQKDYNKQSPTVKNEYKPSTPSTPSTVKPKNEYKPSTPTITPKPSQPSYKPSATPSSGSKNTYKPK